MPVRRRKGAREGRQNVAILVVVSLDDEVGAAQRRNARGITQERLLGTLAVDDRQYGRGAGGPPVPGFLLRYPQGAAPRTGGPHGPLPAPCEKIALFLKQSIM